MDSTFAQTDIHSEKIAPPWSKPRRVAAAVVSVLTLTFVCGTLYGFQALLPMLIDHGAYSELCSGPVTAKSRGYDAIAQCRAQDLRLNLGFTLALAINGGFAPISGFIRDKVGPKLAGVIGGVIFAVGTLIFGVVDQGDSFIFGMILFQGFGAPLLYFSAYTTPKLFPKHSSLLTSLWSLCFDASSGVFVLFGILYFSAGVPFYVLFILLAVLAGIFAVLYFFMFASPREMTQIESYYQYLMHPQLSVDTRPRTQESLLGESLHVDVPASPSSSITKNIKSASYLLGLGFMSVANLRNNFYMGTLANQLSRLYPSPSPDALDTALLVYNILNTGGALLFAPAIGWLTARFERRDDVIFFTAYALSIVHDISNLLPFLVPQYIGFVIFGGLRPLQWAAIAGFVNKRYPLAQFGRLMGTISAAAAVFGLAVYGMEWMTLNVVGGEYFAANGVLTVLQLLTLIFPLYMRQEYRTQVRPVEQSIEMTSDFDKQHPSNAPHEDAVVAIQNIS